MARASGKDAEVIARAATNDCVEGEHSWKRDDPYDLACAVSVAAVIARPARSLRADAATVHADLTEAGWHTDASLPSRLVEYADRISAVAGGAAPRGGVTVPSANYRDANLDFDLDVSWASPRYDAQNLLDATNLYTLDRTTPHPWRSPAGEQLSGDEVLAALGRGEYALVITIRTEYFAG